MVLYKGGNAIFMGWGHLWKCVIMSPALKMSIANRGGGQGGGGTGIRGAESGVEGVESGVEWAEAGVEGAGRGDRGGWESGKIGAGNWFFIENSEKMAVLGL